MIFTHAFAGAILGKYIVKEQAKTSEVTKRDKSIIYFLVVVGAVFPDFDLLTLLLDKTIHHRYLLTHSFVFYTSIVLLLVPFRKKINFTYLLSFYIGVLSHLALDMITGGLAFFAPFSETIIGIPMQFGKLAKVAYVSTYLRSQYMLAEIFVFVGYMVGVYSQENNSIARKLPIFFSIVSCFAIAAVAVL